MRISIQIRKEFGTFLNTREAALNLGKIIDSKKSATVELDLSGVKFISRSFADQFHKERKHLHEKGISVSLINVLDDIPASVKQID